MTPGNTVVAEMQIAVDAPVPQGGTFVNGIYDLTDETLYTGPGGATGPTGSTKQGTVSFSSGSVEVAEQSGSCSHWQNGTVITSGTQLTFTQTCPPCVADAGSDCGGTQGYTATSTTFQIFEQKSSGTQVTTYTHR